MAMAPHEFYALLESPCPYLPQRQERKLATPLSVRDTTAFYSSLSRAGFRRSHNFAYRPACRSCQACVPVRVAAYAFTPSRSQRRILRMNANLAVRERSGPATSEQYAVFKRYVTLRHADGDMAAMNFREYRAMVECSRLDTRLAEVREPNGRLVAGCLLDWLDDGGSAVYSFFDPDCRNRSLGRFMILWLIGEARRRELPYVYLGYWIRDARKMDYKRYFRPLEGLGPKGWVAVAD